MTSTGFRLLFFAFLCMLFWSLFNIYAEQDRQYYNDKYYGGNFTNETYEQHGIDIEKDIKKTNFRIPDEINMTVLSILGFIGFWGTVLILKPFGE